jgi:hypothetical protein
VPVIVSPSDTRTLGDLKSRIADELARADLEPQIALAITDAIEEASTHRFWFMETRGLTINLSAGVAYYAAADMADLIEIDRLVLVTSGQNRTLRVMSDDEVDLLNDGTAPRGEPYAYSRYGEQLTLYPIPNKAYVIRIDGLTKGQVWADGDSSFWTDPSKGERYIRALAKREILGHVIRNVDAALVQDQYAQRYRQEMFEQTHARIATNEMAACG